MTGIPEVTPTWLVEHVMAEMGDVRGDVDDARAKIAHEVRVARLGYRTARLLLPSPSVVREIRGVVEKIQKAAAAMDGLSQEALETLCVYALPVGLGQRDAVRFAEPSGLAQYLRDVTAGWPSSSNGKGRPGDAAVYQLVKPMLEMYLELAAAPSRLGAARTINPVLVAEENPSDDRAYVSQRLDRLVAFLNRNFPDAF